MKHIFTEHNDIDFRILSLTVVFFIIVKFDSSGASFTMLTQGKSKVMEN
jgi:hypothetical protein